MRSWIALSVLLIGLMAAGCNAHWREQIANVSIDLPVSADAAGPRLREVGFRVKAKDWQLNRWEFYYEIPSESNSEGRVTPTKVTVYGILQIIAADKSRLVVQSFHSYGAPIYRQKDVVPIIESALKQAGF